MINLLQKPNMAVNLKVEVSTQIEDLNTLTGKSLAFLNVILA